MYSEQDMISALSKPYWPSFALNKIFLLNTRKWTEARLLWVRRNGEKLKFKSIFKILKSKFSCQPCAVGGQTNLAGFW